MARAGSEVAGRLTALRAAAGLSQRQLAARAGLPSSVLCAYERGTRMPSAEAFLRIIRAAGGDVAIKGRTADDLRRTDALLQDVLALAELLPQKRRGELAYPAFRSSAV